MGESQAFCSTGCVNVRKQWGFNTSSHRSLYYDFISRRSFFITGCHRNSVYQWVEPLAFHSTTTRFSCRENETILKRDLAFMSNNDQCISESYMRWRRSSLCSLIPITCNILAPLTAPYLHKLSQLCHTLDIPTSSLQRSPSLMSSKAFIKYMNNIFILNEFFY